MVACGAFAAVVVAEVGATVRWGEPHMHRARVMGVKMVRMVWAGRGAEYPHSKNVAGCVASVHP